LDGDYIGGVLFSELGRLQRTCSVRKTEKEEDPFKIITVSTSIDSYVHPDAVGGKLQLPGWRDPLETESSDHWIMNINPKRPGPNLFLVFPASNRGECAELISYHHGVAVEASCRLPAED